MKIKQIIARLLLPRLINSIKVEDVVSFSREGIYLGAYKVGKEELHALKEEIKYFEKARIWEILTNTLAFKAIERIGEKSITFDDVWSGKMMLFNIELQKNILAVIKNYKTPEPLKPIDVSKRDE